MGSNVQNKYEVYLGVFSVQWVHSRADLGKTKIMGVCVVIMDYDHGLFRVLSLCRKLL